VNGQTLQRGDAAKLEGESVLAVSQGKDAEVIVFDLAA
jgi:quercetin 2,3-dioxygenase